MSERAPRLTIYYSLRCRRKAKFTEGMVDAGPCHLDCQHLFWDLLRSKYVCGAGRVVTVGGL